METKKNMFFLKGKESAFINTLLVLATIIFIVPIILVFSLRFLYKAMQKVKEGVADSIQINTNLNKVY